MWSSFIAQECPSAINELETLAWMWTQSGYQHTVQHVRVSEQYKKRGERWRSDYNTPISETFGRVKCRAAEWSGLAEAEASYLVNNDACESDFCYSTPSLVYQNHLMRPKHPVVQSLPSMHCQFDVKVHHTTPYYANLADFTLPSTL